MEDDFDPTDDECIGRDQRDGSFSYSHEVTGHSNGYGSYREAKQELDLDVMTRLAFGD